MPITYDQLGQVTLGTAATSISVTGINTSYTDLRIVFNCPSASVGYRPFYDTNTGSASYSRAITGKMATYNVQGFNYQTGGAGFYMMGSDTIPAASPFSFVADVMGYSQTTTNKVTLFRAAFSQNDSTQTVERMYWIDTATAAQTQVRVQLPDGGTFAVGTSLAVWGIRRA
jgi:hypothetical protein